MSQKRPITLVVITLNEAKCLERCLRSVPFVDEIVVVDSFSQDGTRAIAEKCGAKVVDQEWLGFGAQKNLAAGFAKNDWIFSLDADEACSEELVQEILQLPLNPEVVEGYRIPRKSYHLRRWIGHGGWYPDYQLRLYHRGKTSWSTSSVHEKVQTQKTQNLKSALMHWVFDDLTDQIATNNRYSGLGAQELFKKGHRFRFWKLLVKPTSKFFETYFFKRGFLDGLPGFIIAVGAAYSVFLKFSKLWELEQSQSEAS